MLTIYATDNQREWDGWAPGLAHLSLVCNTGQSGVLCALSDTIVNSTFPYLIYY